MGELNTERRKKTKVVGVRLLANDVGFLAQFAKDTHQDIANLLRPVIQERIVELKTMVE